MNPDNVVQFLQKGFHVTLGATTSLIESLQDAQKRDENLSKLNLEWSVLSEELAEKGAKTEQEARSFVDTLLNQGGAATSQNSSGSSTGTASAPTAAPDIQLELQELTAQIAAIRVELEKLRNQNAS